MIFQFNWLDVHLRLKQSRWQLQFHLPKFHSDTSTFLHKNTWKTWLDILIGKNTYITSITTYATRGFTPLELIQQICESVGRAITSAWRWWHNSRICSSSIQFWMCLSPVPFNTLHLFCLISSNLNYKIRLSNLQFNWYVWPETTTASMEQSRNLTDHVLMLNGTAVSLLQWDGRNLISRLKGENNEDNHSPIYLLSARHFSSSSRSSSTSSSLSSPSNDSGSSHFEWSSVKRFSKFLFSSSPGLATRNASSTWEWKNASVHELLWDWQTYGLKMDWMITL